MIIWLNAPVQVNSKYTLLGIDTDLQQPVLSNGGPIVPIERLRRAAEFNDQPSPFSDSELALVNQAVARYRRPSAKNISESKLLEFREDQLRDDRGQWTVEGEIEAAAKDVAKARELLAKFTKPENREKIATALKDAGMTKADYAKAVGGGSVPKPVSFVGASGIRYAEKMATIYEAAQRGDIEAINAIKTNATSKVHYVKTLHAYKQEVLRLLGKMESRGIEPPTKGVVLDPKVINKTAVAVAKGATRNLWGGLKHTKTIFNYVGFPTSGVEEYEGQHEANKDRMTGAKAVYEKEVARIFKEAPNVQPAKINVHSSDTVINSNTGREANGIYRYIENEIHMGLLSYKKDTGPLTLGSHKVDNARTGTMRHEMGHHVQANMPLVLEDEWRQIAETVDSKKVSEYAGTHSRELFAESFSAYMHPEYKTGMLPPTIEGFMKKATGKK